MAYYTKKPVTVEAFQLMDMSTDKTIKLPPAWFMQAIFNGTVIPNQDGSCSIRTLEGIHLARIGDYIIQGVKKELYPCKEDIFNMTYEALPEVTVK